MAASASQSSGDGLSAAPPAWRTTLARAVRDPAELCRLAGLGPEAAVGSPGFPVLAPRPFLARAVGGNPRDPLLLQVLPQAAEQTASDGFDANPLGEADATCGPGLLWQHRDRLLIVAIGTCAVHCRFCFRRHFPYPRPPEDPAAWDPMLELVRRETSIHEVILSGGDPLVLDDQVLAQFSQRLADIGHLRRLRVHTRMPIMIPERVTDELLACLTHTRVTTSVVIHANHPAEIDQHVAAALGRLVDAGVPVLSQGVLLRGINDEVEVLAALYERLIDLRVIPYYLHQLDRVAGAAHFEVPESRGVELIAQLRARLPGYAVPRYVRQVPRGGGKRVLA